MKTCKVCVHYSKYEGDMLNKSNRGEKMIMYCRKHEVHYDNTISCSGFEEEPIKIEITPE